MVGSPLNSVSGRGVWLRGQPAALMTGAKEVKARLMPSTL